MFYMLQSRGMLQNALNVFSDVAETRPNKISICGFILASLEAKYYSILHFFICYDKYSGYDTYIRRVHGQLCYTCNTYVVY